MEDGSREKLLNTLKTFRNAMLVTTASDGMLRSRPMALMKVDEPSGDIWFMTSSASGKVDEIETHAQVNVSLQKDNAFLSISGKASINRDRAKLDEIWSEEAKVYFPKGKEDPDLALIKVSPAEGEYWDNEGVNGLKLLIASVKAYVTGTTPDFDKSQHAAVHLEGSPKNGSKP